MRGYDWYGKQGHNRHCRQAQVAGVQLLSSAAHLERALWLPEPVGPTCVLLAGAAVAAGTAAPLLDVVGACSAGRLRASACCAVLDCPAGPASGTISEKSASAAELWGDRRGVPRDNVRCVLLGPICVMVAGCAVELELTAGGLIATPLVLAVGWLVVAGPGGTPGPVYTVEDPATSPAGCAVGVASAVLVLPPAVCNGRRGQTHQEGHASGSRPRECMHRLQPYTHAPSYTFTWITQIFVYQCWSAPEL